MHGVPICPTEIEKVIREHPEVVDCVVAGVRGVCQSDGLVPRAWLVLSESAKAKDVECMLGAIEEFLRDRLSDRHWLHGGIEVIDEVLPQFAPAVPLLTLPRLRYRNCRAGKCYGVNCNMHMRHGSRRECESRQNCSVCTKE